MCSFLVILRSCDPKLRRSRRLHVVFAQHGVMFPSQITQRDNTNIMARQPLHLVEWHGIDTVSSVKACDILQIISQNLNMDTFNTSVVWGTTFAALYHKAKRYGYRLRDTQRYHTRSRDISPWSKWKWNFTTVLQKYTHTHCKQYFSKSS